MGLREQLEEDKKKLEELQKEAEAPESVAETEEIVEEKPEEKVEAKPEEGPEEKQAEDDQTGKTPAQIRIEKRNKERLLADQLASERAELAAARARIAELERPAPKTDADPEPNKSEDPTAWLEWDNRQLKKEVSSLKKTTETIVKKEQAETTKQSALNEIQGYEAQVRAKYPDYDAAKSHYATILATGVKLLNPSITNQQLNQVVEFKMIERAAKYQSEGHENPIEAMYEEAKTWGFKGPSKEIEDKELKPDLKKVAVNRAKNAGTAAAQGSGGTGEITLNHLAREMTVAEIAKLPKGQVEKILRNAQGG